MDEDELLQRITMNPNICFGKPTIRNMRYPVVLILDLLSGGMTHEEILADYPSLVEEDILAVLQFAARLVRMDSAIEVLNGSSESKQDFKGITPRIAPSVFIADDAKIIGDVEIGEDASVWFGSVLRGDVNYIRVGARTNIQDQTIIHVSSKGLPTILEENITVGHRVTLHACYVESGCLIGMGAILMDGVRVGKNSLVAAGSLVTPGTQIPPNSLVVGSPARVKRELTADELVNLDRSWRNYVELKQEYLNRR